MSMNSCNEKKITIGIPAFKRPEYTKEAIASCLAQTYSNFEIIVSDDSPTDEIEQMAQSFKSDKISYFRNQSSLGLIRNANVILGKATGEWMLILANDDALEPEYLETVNNIISSYPAAALIRSRYHFINDKGEIVRTDKPSKFLKSSFEYLSETFCPPKISSWMSISAVAFPTEHFKKVGGFKEFHRGHHADRVAWAELAAFGDCIWMQEPMARVRFHHGEISAIADPNYKLAVVSTLKMEKICEELLVSMGKQALTRKDKKHIELARHRLAAHVVRQMNRSFDEGIMGLIEQNKMTSPDDFSRIKNEIKLLELPFFSSCYFYQIIMQFPVVMRMFFLACFKEYKFKRWHL